MALTLAVEQRLKAQGLVALFDKQNALWKKLAQETYTFVQQHFDGAVVRPDDVAKELTPLLEVNQALRGHLSAQRLTQKYWIGDFADLVLDRTWAEIAKE